jgi:hypothetical protein
VRFAYLDNLKVLLVVGVIGVHTAIIYGVEGSFYLEDYQSMGGAAAGVLTVFTAVGFLRDHLARDPGPRRGEGGRLGTATAAGLASASVRARRVR